MVGSVEPLDAWQALLADPACVLVDVRTEAEWRQIGVPDLAQAGRRPLLISWQFPTGQINPGFTDALRTACVTPEQTVLFLCRSGVRSLSAAYAAEAAGYTACLNVEHGFEGDPDARGQRGRIAGWQASSLPWTRP